MKFITIYHENKTTDFAGLSVVEALANCQISIVDDGAMNVYVERKPKTTAKYVADLLSLQVIEYGG